MKIVILSPEISLKIAAGEVIERPFSVVKELVENSLDAGSSEIKVELAGGGKKLVRVTDNGQGMASEDALLCFERHSTSKISSLEDLNRISTLGFRGEALPSISAVSRVILKTSDGSGDSGTLVEREGEKLIRISDTAFPRGTSVEVRDLFFNLPAREKFLRSDKSELSSVVKHLSVVSLAYPEKRFSLFHGTRHIFDYSPVKSLKERIFQIYGKSFLEHLLEVDFRDNSWKVFGYASLPPSGRRDKSLQLFFVNRRPVRDRTLQAALNQAYRGFLEKDNFAQSIIFLFCPYNEVDINVHPTKAEVRFRDSSLVFHLLLESIEQALLKAKGIKEVYPAKAEEKAGLFIEGGAPPAFPPRREEEASQQASFFPLAEEEKTYPRALGQYLDSYIVALSKEGIIIVDQHNAHERILFEHYQEIDRLKKWPQKMALLPVVFEFSVSQTLSFEENEAQLEEVGFRIESMGGRSFALKEYPDIFKEEEAKEIFLSLLEEMEKEKIEDKKKKILATLACKTAVKAGQALSLEKMNTLVEELFKTSNSSVCPHGRPVMIMIDRKEVERALKRS